MLFELIKLPYNKNALEPFISAKTFSFHYDKHHQTYVNNLNSLIDGTEYAEQPLEEIIKTSTGAIFNNAAQIWNHNFLWHSMTDKKDQTPTEELTILLNTSFSSIENFLAEFKKNALANFGSGWTWLVYTPKNTLEIVNTSNASCPLTTDNVPLLVCDVWEHAYYLDTQNNRGKYIDNFFEVLCWDFVSANLNAAR